MIKPASSLCNLSCEYCFYRDVSEHREHLGFGIMEKGTAEILIKKSLDFASGEPVAFAFQGGEPTLAGMDFFRFFVEKVRSLNTKKSPVFYSIQTNGTTINGEWADFFRDNGFLVGLSLDGSYEDNKFRKKPDGTNSYYKITSAAEILKRHGVEFNILKVLTGYCAENGEKIYKYFRSQGFYYVHAPILTGSDCEGAGEMFQVTTLDLNNVPKTEDGKVDFSQDFYGKPTNLTVSGQLNGETFAMAFKNIYTFGPTFRAENSNTTRHAAEMKECARVAASIVLETRVVGRVQGLQIEGEATLAEGEEFAAAKSAYLKKFPYAAVAELHLWLLRPVQMKLTDNTLGFGRKLIWMADE